MDQLLPTAQVSCPFCSTLVDATAIFCPTCGKNLKEKPLSTETWTQIKLYAVSIFFPPLFFWWTMKYLKSTHPKEKQIGYISLGLTVIAILFSVWFSFTISRNLTQELNKQLILYQNVGL